MEGTGPNFSQLTAPSKGLLRRLLTIGENRLELLTVEMQEERERLLHALLLGLGIAAFGLLAAMTLTGVVIVLLWSYSPLAVLSVLTVLYAGTAFYLSRRLSGFLRQWQAFSGSLDQLRKDRIILENLLS